MTITIYRDLAGGYRWRVTAVNGCIVADSGQAYKRRIDLMNTLANLFVLEKFTIRYD